MSGTCPYCGASVSGYHKCPDGSDRVAFECSDCHEQIHRDTHQMDITGLAPGRCATCTLEAMAE